MLTFFRRIRNRLLHSGFTSKYMLYAMGEIALVVFGILIALQINNWNEGKKDRANEIKIYKEILNDLEECKNDILNDLEIYEELIRGTGYVRNHMFKRMPLTDSLLYFMKELARDQQFYPKKSAFESLQTLGLYTLSNDSVRLEITNLYQLGFGRLEKRGREGDAFRIEKLMRPYINKHMVLVEDPDNTSSEYSGFKRSISNYEDFLNDQQFLEALEWLGELRFYKMRNFRFGLSETERGIRLVQNELGRLES